ncbi:MAG: hypothetical protein ACR2LA_02520 [Acidimicrobiales bacterium]
MTHPAVSTTAPNDHAQALDGRAPTGASALGDPETASGGPAWASRRPDWGTVAVVGLVAVVFALPMRALFRYQGPPMEEGFMLVFPEQVLNGGVPHRDFLHLYGPGSLWALAAWYKALGVSITAERIFGAAQLGAVVFGVMALARPWGRRVAATTGVVGVVLTTTAIGLTALAWDGAVALAVAATWVGLRARRWLTDAPGATAGDADRRAGLLLVGSGVLAGLALLFRPDVVVAVALSTVALLAGLGWRRWKRWLLGAVPVLSLYVVHLAVSGPGDAIRGMFVEPVFDLRAGRSLPRPPSYDHFDGALQGVAALRPVPWALPSLGSPQEAFWWFFLLPAATLFVVGVGWWRVRAEPGAWRPRVVLAVGLLGLGLMPQAFQRPDTTHLAWVSCVPIAFLPAAIAELLGHLPVRSLRRAATTVAAVVALGVPLFAIPRFTASTYVDLVKQGARNDVFGYPVTHGGRRFYLGSPEVARVAQRMLDDIGPDVVPGQRLLVGTADLRKTPYSDAYLYYLLPDATPGTRYIEMDPAVANAPDSGLAGEVARSDWLVLSHVWDAWSEPNASRDFGPDAPNRVVQRKFCPVGDYAPYFEVYRRCR